MKQNRNSHKLHFPISSSMVLILSVILSLTGTQAVSAQVTTWYVSPAGNDSNSCTAIAEACRQVFVALFYASAGDTIKVESGFYGSSGGVLLLLDKNITLSGGWNSTFTTQNGESTIIGGSGQKGIQVNAGITATVDYFVIQNQGTQQTSSGNGGGVVNNGSLTMTGSTIENFILASGYSGGGIYNAGTMVLNNCTISGNTASFNTGGGGGIWNDGNLTLNNCDINNNRSTIGAGGGIWNSTVGTLTLTDSIVSDNEAYYGGNGILNSGTMTINNSIISDNSSSPASSSGGGIFNTATLTLNNSTVNNNNAGEAGGIFNNGGNVTINNSAITGNHAGTTGGIRSSGSTILNNSTIANNTSSYTAGGIYNFGTFTASNSTISNNTANCEAGGIFNQGTFTLKNSTVSANTVGCYGGGILNDPAGSVTLQNTILAGNTSTSIDPDCRGTLNSAGYNLVGNNSGCTISTTTGDQVGTSSTPIDPRLTALQNNGGPTDTRGLIDGSPAINAGNPAVPGSGGNACLATDQRDVTRPIDATCDIGAYEGRITVVNSITLLDPNPTQASSVNFTVTFSDSVTGVNISAPFDDFAPVTTGMTTASISAVSGSGDTYVVTVNIETGSGTIKLDSLDDDSILNSDSDLLGGAGLGNGSFTTGETYTFIYISLPAPKVANYFFRFLTNDSTPTLSWSSVYNAFGYEIKIATDEAFTNIVLTENPVTPAFTPSTPLSDGTYYWKVRALTQFLQAGRFSRVQTLTIDATAPTAPTMTSPMDGADLKKSPALRWLKISDAILYEVQIDDNTGFSSPTTYTARTAFRRLPALPDGIYYWRVRAKDTAGNWGSWSGYREFEIDR